MSTSKRRGQGWRLDQDQVTMLDRAVKSLCRAFPQGGNGRGCTKRALEIELQLAEKGLAPSKMAARPQDLQRAVRKANLRPPDEYGQEAYLQLAEVSCAVSDAISGFGDARPLSAKYALEIGRVAVELYDGHICASTAQLLGMAWRTLKNTSPTSTIALHVGSRLLEWSIYQGKLQQASTVARELGALAQGVRHDDEYRVAIACAEQRFGNLGRHDPEAKYQDTVRHIMVAHRLFSEAGDTAQQITVLLHLVKEYVAQALGIGVGSADYGKLAEAFEVISHIDSIVGKAKPATEFAAVWVHCQCVFTETYCAVGYAMRGSGNEHAARGYMRSAAKRWEALQGWSGLKCCLLESNGTQLAAKVPFTAPMPYLARGEDLKARELIEQVVNQGSMQPFVDRRNRLNAVAQAIRANIPSTAVKAIFTTVAY